MPTWPASGRASTSSRVRSPPPTRDCSRQHSTPALLRRPTTAPCGASPRPRKSVRKAEAQEQEAKKAVKDQRSGIVTFVTESYQNGTELNSATAVMGGEGPKGLMNRYGVVESAGDSMEAAYDDFRKATVVAKAYTKKAAKAQKRQESLADRGTRAAQRRRGGRQLSCCRCGPDRHAEGAAGPGARGGPEHLRRAGGRAPAGHGADRAGEGRRCRPGQGARGGQGGTSFAGPSGPPGSRRATRGLPGATTPRHRTTASPPDPRPVAATSTPARRSTAHRPHPATAHSARSPTPRRSWASPTSGQRPARTPSTAPA